MISFHSRIYLFLLFCLWFSTHTWAEEKSFYRIGPNEDWITQIQVDPSRFEADLAYGLVDRQYHTGRKEGFSRFYNVMTDKAILNQFKNIKVEVDPEYQKLVWHKVLIHREGQEINILKQDQIKIFQREEGLERSLLDGRKTIMLLISDLRKGDHLEYSYTVIGEVPILKGDTHLEYALRWGVNVGRSFLKVVHPKSSPKLYHQFLNGSPLSLNFKEDENHITFSLDQNKIKKIYYDDGVPSWYDETPRLAFSTFSNWEDVVNWGLPIYAPPKTLSSELNNLISKIKNKEQDEEARARAAVDFIQNEIHYFGLGMGLGSHLPRPTQDIFKTRFGDCKEKVLLLISILNKIGIESYPVLVDTSYGPRLPTLPPSPYAFNHVIAAIKINFSTYYIDTTITRQGGRLEDRFFPTYHHGLSIRPGTKDLNPLPTHNREGKPLVEIVENFYVLSQNQPVRLECQATYRYNRADGIRRYFEDTKIDEIEKNYVNYFEYRYRGTRLDGSIEFVDDPIKNIVRVKDQYLIDDMPDRSDEEKTLTWNFFSDWIRSDLPSVQSPKRTSPVYISHPFDTHYVRKVNLNPEVDWTFDDEYLLITNPSFTLSCNTVFSNSVLSHTFRYITHKDHATLEELPELLKALEQARDQMTYGIFDLLDSEKLLRKQAQPEDEDTDSPMSFEEWFPLVLVMGFFLFIIPILILINRLCRDKAIHGYSPFLTIWFSPKRTILCSIDVFPHRFFIVLTLLSGTLEGLFSLIQKGKAEEMDISTVFTVSFAGGSIGMVIKIFILSWLLSITGKRIGGIANSKSLRSIYAYAFIPNVFIALITILQFSIFGSETIFSTNEELDAGTGMVVLYNTLNYSTIPFDCFVIFIFLMGVAVVQNFSFWKALLNFFLAMLMILIPILMLGAIFAIFA